MKGSFALVVLLSVTPGAAPADALKQVTMADLDKYWILAPERMDGVMPAAARGAHAILQRHGEVRVEFELTIDSNGVPGDLEFKSITPGDADPRPFIAMQLFYRYRPGPDNPGAIPVRLSAEKKNFIPRAEATERTVRSRAPESSI